ncbi:MAG: LysE family transporter [Acidobacteriota bacterium]
MPALVASAFLVSLATVAVPGPITLVASRLALGRGIAPAAWFLAGSTALDVVFFAALATGAAPWLRSLGALPVVEITGGLALLWGGVASLRAAPVKHTPRRLVDDARVRSAASNFVLGVAVSIGNPHYWIWWVTAGLAFVEAARTHGTLGLAWMLGALIAGVVSWYVPLLWALRRGRALLSPRGERIVVRVMSAALIVLGGALVAFGFRRL